VSLKDQYLARFFFHLYPRYSQDKDLHVLCTLLYCPICTREDYSILQEDINNWATANLMTFNISKYKCMLIGLETVTTFKYLGVLMSSNLQWSPHIQDVCSKARKIISLLYK